MAASASPAAATQGADQLAVSPAWLKLLHYERTAENSYRSRVTEPGFFLSKTGAHDPRAELMAFLQALGEPTRSVGVLQQPAACVFPARLRLVRERLGIVVSAPECPDLERWRGRLAAESVSLVFASAYVSNPASLFGHTLLRINTNPASDDPALSARELLNYTVSFLATTDPDDNALTYTYKGLAGGYSGTFNVDPYYMTVAIYNDAEDRDLWEYDIELPPAVMTGLVDHLWELSNNARLAYYFATENCSFQLLAVLEAVMPELDLTGATGALVLPLDTVRVALSSGLHAKRVRQRPSLGSVLQTAVAALSDEWRRDFEKLIVPTANDATLLATAEVAPLDAAIAYWSYRKLAVAGQLPEDEASWMRALLRRRAQLGTSEGSAALPRAQPSPARRPDLGHATSAVGLSVGRTSADESFAGVMLRSGLHDILADAASYGDAAAITYGDVEGRIVSQGNAKPKVEIERAVIADVTSLSPYTALIPRWSWRLGGGGRRIHLLGEARSAPFAAFIDTAGGVTVAPTASSLAFVMATYAHDAGPGLDQGFRARPGMQAGWLWRTTRYRTLLQATWGVEPAWYGRTIKPFTDAMWRHAWSMSREDELRAEGHWSRQGDQKSTGWSLGFVRHF